jgi:hypothetical protein
MSRVSRWRHIDERTGCSTYKTSPDARPALNRRAKGRNPLKGLRGWECSPGGMIVISRDCREHTRTQSLQWTSSKEPWVLNPGRASSTQR